MTAETALGLTLLWLATMCLSSPSVLAWHRLALGESRSPSISALERKDRAEEAFADARRLSRWLRPALALLLAALTLLNVFSPPRPCQDSAPATAGCQGSKNPPK